MRSVCRVHTISKIAYVTAVAEAPAIEINACTAATSKMAPMSAMTTEAAVTNKSHHVGAGNPAFEDWRRGRLC
jgi:hypothetical protein